MTVLLGPLPCHDCGATVHVVRRTIVFLCPSHARLCTTESHAPTVVEDDGTTHLCPGVAIARAA